MNGLYATELGELDHRYRGSQAERLGASEIQHEYARNMDVPD